MVTTVIPRQLPGIALLGLLSALLAHTAAYGGEHAAGGPYHTLLLLVAIAGAGLFAVVGGSVALVGARRHADGSILAAALRTAIPGPGALLGSATLWFVTIEALEPHHAAAPVVLVVAALILASLAVGSAARGFVRGIAEIAFAVTAAPFHKRPVFRRHRFSPPPSARTVAFAYRRFARPPPLTLLR